MTLKILSRLGPKPKRASRPLVSLPLAYRASPLRNFVAERSLTDANLSAYVSSYRDLAVTRLLPLVCGEVNHGAW